MSTHSLGGRVHHGTHGLTTILSSNWAWLGIGFAVAFATPSLLADTLEMSRDLFYGLYAMLVLALFWGWARATGYELGVALRRRWVIAVVLGAACGALLTVMVLRTEDATARPGGLELGAEVLWRGVVYGAVDGLLLSAFPILLVFAALASWRVGHRWRRTLAVGVVAMTVSVLMTAVYHAGYSDFRSDKIRKPITGDLVWSVPTLVTLNPVGAPIAHAAMHVSAVLHSYETDTFLPPHS